MTCLSSIEPARGLEDLVSRMALSAVASKAWGAAGLSAALGGPLASCQAHLAGVIPHFCSPVRSRRSQRFPYLRHLQTQWDQDGGMALSTAAGNAQDAVRLRRAFG